MKSAYRIPTGKFAITEHFASQMTATNEPITEIVVSSMITAPQIGDVVRANATAEIRGFAWDGGCRHPPRGNFHRRRCKFGMRRN